MNDKLSIVLIRLLLTSALTAALLDRLRGGNSNGGSVVVLSSIEYPLIKESFPDCNNSIITTNFSNSIVTSLEQATH